MSEIPRYWCFDKYQPSPNSWTGTVLYGPYTYEEAVLVITLHGDSFNMLAEHEINSRLCSAGASSLDVIWQRVEGR